METSLLNRLAARDRNLYIRWALDDGSALAFRAVLTAITHAGGAFSSLALAALPLVGVKPIAAAGAKPLAALVISHLIVQQFKRTVGRPRPSRSLTARAMIAEPDRFSFPSGHAAAAMSIAVVYAVLFPALSVPVILSAAAVGLTRVFLGVHYPGDVIAGQLIAVATALAVLAR
ncbi:MAG TPA: phosphatase PAP2 family protein [Gemmatimonadaceae bacterium]|nr:phosphatase PAP2 family protein [Gemmatimonadaceae bacterium]